MLGDEFPALQWHGDTFGIPAGAVHLARSAAYPHQAFRFGETAYAVQFHVEVTEEMLAEWGHVPAYQKSAEAVLGSAGFELLAAGFAAAQDSMARSADAMFNGWLDQAERAAVQRETAPGCNCRLTPRTRRLATVNTAAPASSQRRARGVLSQHRVI